MIHHKKLLDFAHRELWLLRDQLILPDDHGYNVFAHYRIDRENSQYRVSKRHNDCGVFRTTRTALAWCLADKHQDHGLAREILDLESAGSRIQQDLAVRSSIAQKAKSGSQWQTMYHKTLQRQRLKTNIDSQLEKCVARAKYYQIRGSLHETE